MPHSVTPERDQDAAMADAPTEQSSQHSNTESASPAPAVEPSQTTAASQDVPDDMFDDDEEDEFASSAPQPDVQKPTMYVAHLPWTTGPDDC